MRIFFIPGLGEDISIFDKIKPFIEGEKVFLDNWKLLEDVSEKDLTALIYAKYLIARFNISKKDLVVGHSMGGWVAWYIKHLINCPVVQIASWTDMKKVSIPLNKRVIYWSARRGLGLNSLVLRTLVFLRYKSAPSKDVFIATFKRLISGDKTIVVKQLKVIFNPINEKTTTMPDLRIHAISDNLVRPPDEAFVEVPGDHFTLYTYPETVYGPIQQLLRQLQ